MSAEAIFIFSTSIILLVIKPGPGQALRIATALRDGFWSAMFIVFGVTLICNVYLVLASIGSNFVSSFLTDSSRVFRLIGGIYLIYLGYKGLKKKQISIDTIKNRKSHIQYFMMGCALSLSNPIDIFFFVGILPGLVELGTLSVQNVITFMIIMTTITLVIDALILTAVAQSRTTLTRSGFGNTIRIIANSGLIAVGLFLLWPF